MDSTHPPVAPSVIKPKPSGTSKPRRAAKKRDIFVNVTAEEASGDSVLLSAHSVASGIYLDKLTLTKDQEVQIQELHQKTKCTDSVFRPLDEQEQLAAAALLATNHLDCDSRESLGSRWSVKWGKTTGSNREGQTRRVLYQCDCGYDHTVAGHKKRRNAVDFTGCLAHAEITYAISTQKILRVRGYLEHNQGCQDALLARYPAMPLHPSVYQTALGQLKAGSILTDIQEKNRKMIASRLYPGMTNDEKTAGFRYLLRASDTRSLYRQFNRLQGIKVSDPAHLNVHEWLDQHSPQYDATLANAIFHYSARANKEDRFEVCVATDQMKKSAWKYGHKSQIILDGTFGVCDKKLLLFIVMAIDENGKGVPLAFMFFSAPSGNRHTAAGYNTEILAKLLGQWKLWLGSENNQTFECLVAITDTDLMERNALVVVFPRIWLLICKFHLRQSWRNHRNKLLKGKSQIHIDVKNRLRRIEEKLVTTTNIGEARQIIQGEVEVLELMGTETSNLKTGSADVGVIERGIQHLRDYLLGHWTTDALWRSWSDFGRRVAAQIMNCSFEGVLPTTNHLESFNGLLKRKHLRRWQNGGRRLRIDVLLKLLVTRVLPSIFDQRIMEREQDELWKAQMRKIPGGEALLRERSECTTIVPSVAFLVPDETRDVGAAKLVSDKQIGAPVLNGNQLQFDCLSSLALQHDSNPTVYQVVLGLDGAGSCSCPDFMQRGGACKHIRAALLYLEALRQAGSSIPNIQLPSSVEEAQALQSRFIHESLVPSLPGSVATTVPSTVSVIQDAATAVEDVLRESEDAYQVEEDTDDDPQLSDVESVATDAEDNGDEEDDVLRVESLPQSAAASSRNAAAPIPEFQVDLANLQGSAKAAISEQAIARVFYDLEQTKLGDCRQYLERAPHLRGAQDYERAGNISAELEKLLAELSRLRLDYESTSQSCSTPSEAPLAAAVMQRTHKRKRLRDDIIPPSPEKASKRKTSYGVH